MKKIKLNGQTPKNKVVYEFIEMLKKAGKVTGIQLDKQIFKLIKLEFPTLYDKINEGKKNTHIGGRNYTEFKFRRYKRYN